MISDKCVCQDCVASGRGNGKMAVYDGIIAGLHNRLETVGKDRANCFLSRNVNRVRFKVGAQFGATNDGPSPAQDSPSISDPEIESRMPPAGPGGSLSFQSSHQEDCASCLVLLSASHNFQWTMKATLTVLLFTVCLRLPHQSS